jgi:acetolactate decarboxylase
MDRKFFLGIAVAVAVIFFAAAFATGLSKSTEAAQDRDTLYQVSTIDALMQGVYEGVQPFSEVKKHGDFGIGTFDALDGEMIAVDGKFYQARYDGSVNLVDNAMTTPLAMVTFFERDMVLRTDRPMNFSEFSSEISAKLPSRNMIYAVRIDGTFPVMKVRSIPRQQKPYPALVDAARNQSVYTYLNATGTVAGLYMPSFFKGLNVEGFHLHFISADKKTGGHILDMTLRSGTTAELDITPRFDISLPTSGAFAGADLTKETGADLAKVEH